MKHYTATIQVNIGRNIGSEPMSEQQWSDFRFTVFQKTVESCRQFLNADGLGVDVVACLTGRDDVWQEDSHHLVLGVSGDSVAIDADGLCSDLMPVCERYRQDCISVTYLQDDGLGWQRYVTRDGW